MSRARNEHAGAPAGAIRADAWTAIPPIVRRRLPNGLRLLLIEKRDLPLVSMELLVDAGARLDPRGKEGLASLTSVLLRRGTRQRSAEEFATAADSLGAVFGTGADQDEGHLSGEFLSRDTAAALELAAEVVTQPTFPDEEIAKRVQIAVDGIGADKDYPPSVMGRYFDAALFGAHPYGRPPGGDERSLPRINRDDVAAFHAAAFDPARAVLALAGDFDADPRAREAEKVFGGFAARRAPSSHDDSGAGAVAGVASPQLTAVTSAERAIGSRVLLVDAPDELSCYFCFGNVGVAFGDPEWAPLQLAATILGGQFTSWLNMALRVEEGLTYGVSAAFYRRRAPGPFCISSFTPVEHAERAIDLALAQLMRLHEQGVDDDALRAAKNYLRGQFPLSVETSDQIAEVVALLEMRGMDRRYVDEYLDRVESATVARVNECARRVFPRDDLIFTLIGPAARLQSVAERFGPVTLKRLQDPGF
jgi:predicted Zn-dependent peptidase